MSKPESSKVLITEIDKAETSATSLISMVIYLRTSSVFHIVCVTGINLLTHSEAGKIIFLCTVEPPYIEHPCVEPKMLNVERCSIIRDLFK